MQEHQRQQPPNLGLVGHQLAQQPREPDRLAAQLGPHQPLALGRRVALVEDQIQHAENAAQPVGQLLVVGHPVRDPRVGDLALGADDPLAHRRLRDQERARDLAGREPAERAQRQRHPRRQIERRMAAGEDQPQAVIDDRALLVLVGVLLAIEPHQLRQPIRSIRHRPVAAHPIDRPPPRGDREPRARLGRDAVAPPRADRVRERVLDRVLRQLKVAHMSDQRRQHRRALPAERRRDRGADRIRARAAWRLRRAQDAPALRSGRGISSSATIGRTSTDPYRAHGSLAACLIASSRSEQSST